MIGIQGINLEGKKAEGLEDSKEEMILERNKIMKDLEINLVSNIEMTEETNLSTETGETIEEVIVIIEGTRRTIVETVMIDLIETIGGKEMIEAIDKIVGMTEGADRIIGVTGRIEEKESTIDNTKRDRLRGLNLLQHLFRLQLQLMRNIE